MTRKVLIVEDDPRTRFLIRARLHEWGYQTLLAATLRDARTVLRDDRPDVVLIDVGLPDGSGLDLLGEIRRGGSEPGVVMITGNVFTDNLLAALRSRVHFMEKPINYRTLKVAIEAALIDADQRSKVRPTVRDPDLITFEDIIGDSIVMRACIQVAREVAVTDSSVLLRGETGTGKDMLARAIHYASKRASAPFIGVSIAEKPRGLVASEIFGHERGAFTGAIDRRIGLFEQANTGTLFLDEIGELQPDLQVTLLRALQERTIRRLAGKRDIKFDVRVMAATNRDLGQAISANAFREDLYYRLAVIEIHVPPLRQRGDDVLLLANHFLEVWSKRHGKHLEGIPADVAARFLAFDWPGNVRELSNAIERAVILGKGDRITTEGLPDSLRQMHRAARATTPPIQPAATVSLDEMQLAAVRGVLAETRGNVSEAARRLQISRGKLRHLLKKLGARERNNP